MIYILKEWIDPTFEDTIEIKSLEELNEFVKTNGPVMIRLSSLGKPIIVLSYKGGFRQQ